MNRNQKSNKSQNKVANNVKFKHSTNKKLSLANSVIKNKKQFRGTLKNIKHDRNSSIITNKLKSRVKHMKRSSRVRNNSRAKNGRDTSDEQVESLK